MLRFKSCSNRLWALCLLVASVRTANGQTFALKQVSDSLSVLTLRTDSTFDRRQFTRPVYRFCTGDLNGDGQDEAMVGVVQRTRFYKEPARRLFIFKNYHGQIRALWMGSKLGGVLQDFRFTDGCVRSLETDNDGDFYVSEYALGKFGLKFRRFLIEKTTKDEALQIFNQIDP